MLAENPADNHRHAITGEAAPGAGHIGGVTVRKSPNPENVHKDHYSRTDGTHHRAPECPVGQFVPERKIEIDPHENLSGHNDWDHLEPCPVSGLNQMLQQRHIEHHGKVGQQGENQIVFHPVRKRLRVVAVTAAVEDQRLVSVAEGLGQNGHKHSYLHAGPVYAQLDTSFLAGKKIRKENLVGDLIEYAHEAEYEQRPSVGEHTAGKSPVEAVAQATQFP